MLKKMILSTAAVMLTTSAFAQADLVFDNALANASLAGAPNTSAFVSITNKGNTAATITEVSSNSSRRVELHDMKVVDGIMKMQAMPNLTVPAGKTVTLKSGGMHLMLLNLAQPLKEGDTVDIDFKLADGSTTSVKFKVKARK